MYIIKNRREEQRKENRRINNYHQKLDSERNREMKNNEI
jgi:hypothetical protein